MSAACPDMLCAGITREDLGSEPGMQYKKTRDGGGNAYYQDPRREPEMNHRSRAGEPDPRDPGGRYAPPFGYDSRTDFRAHPEGWKPRTGFTDMPEGPPPPSEPEKEIDPDDLIEQQEKARKEEALKQATKERKERLDAEFAERQKKAREERRKKEEEDARRREEERMRQRAREGERAHSRRRGPFEEFWEEAFGKGSGGNHASGSFDTKPPSLAGSLDSFLGALPQEMRSNVARSIRASIHPDRYGGKHDKISKDAADVLDKYK